MATLLAASHQPRLLRFIGAVPELAQALEHGSMPLYPVRSTSVLMMSVTTASSESSDATANAPTKLYSL